MKKAAKQGSRDPSRMDRVNSAAGGQVKVKCPPGIEIRQWGAGEIGDVALRFPTRGRGLWLRGLERVPYKRGVGRTSRVMWTWLWESARPYAAHRCEATVRAAITLKSWRISDGPGPAKGPSAHHMCH